jgi:anti-sigma-K factor RskA
LFLVLALVFGSLWLRQQITPAQKAIGPEGMQALSLTSTEVVPGASGFIIISADGRNGALVLDRLPQLDPAQQYQLWLVRDGQRTSGAVLSVDQSGYGGTRVVAPEPLFSYSSAEVTIEPAGGSPTPTGDPILWVSLQ